MNPPRLEWRKVIRDDRDEWHLTLVRGTKRAKSKTLTTVIQEENGMWGWTWWWEHGQAATAGEARRQAEVFIRSWEAKPRAELEAKLRAEGWTLNTYTPLGDRFGVPYQLGPSTYSWTRRQPGASRRWWDRWKHTR